MAASVVEEVTNSDPNFATSTNTIAATFTTTVAAGDHLVALVCHDTGGGAGTVSVSDSLNGAWPAVLDSAVDSVDGGDLSSFCFSNSASGAAIVVTATLSANHVGKGIRIYRIGGAPGGLQADANGHNVNGQPQVNPGGGTDAITSGTVTPTSQPALIISLCQDTSGAATPSVGTNYTDGGTGWGFGGVASARSENRRVTSTSATAATYTASGAGATHTYCTQVLTFLEVAGPVITAQPTPQSGLVGSTATFTITATGTGTLHYQWRQNGSNVGTDSSSYTTPTLDMSYDKSQYDCIVTDDGGSTTSNTALLSVFLVISVNWFTA